MNINHIKLVAVAMTAFIGVSAWSAPLLRVVHEPQQVPTCSSKTETSISACQWCGSRMICERTYKWDVYEREWIETTKPSAELCRKCKAEQKEREKLARKEAELDRKLDTKATKDRIAEKRQLLRDWNSVQ